MNDDLEIPDDGKESPISKTMDICHKILDDAQKEGLELEVVVWALQEMKDNPGLLPEEALWIGYNEWVK